MFKGHGIWNDKQTLKMFRALTGFSGPTDYVFCFIDQFLITLQSDMVMNMAIKGCRANVVTAYFSCWVIQACIVGPADPYWPPILGPLGVPTAHGSWHLSGSHWLAGRRTRGKSETTHFAQPVRDASGDFDPPVHGWLSLKDKSGVPTLAGLLLPGNSAHLF